MAREIRISVRQTVNFETANAKFVRRGLHRVGSLQLPAVRAGQPDGYTGSDSMKLHTLALVGALCAFAAASDRSSAASALCRVCSNL